ncbi:tetratricopeptide repeat protein (plasmid) [Ralstonia solanacearum P673]|uniref:tetratricopeptide repeat protein n=1 Tax=Ralstonia solanacearum TaxID=305 RepID=UPI00057F9D5B|nr:tetratricopeptide repeat protein [Ralstonia solanacearum]MCL9850006.1 tetratricopeptide repeat protein [Ralstonia solanacearum]MCL9856309.1 tetratricopeptide repeat protein [Ralstonia solanacearum]MCL9860549.1 tetratricopeptide repeat protein [Ralstonia solanacearum]MCL9865926.1 tetratricopeptide repeat protein [Ralstonia solanacearum]MCL9870713.1 tetratricopeptide repeat protein [Ralstonia solanacearum]
MTTETLAHSLAEEVTPATMLQMAGWHAQSGDPAQAERCYRWVLERDPHHVPALQRLASLLQSDGQRAPEALPLLDAAIALQPHAGALHAARAIALNALERRLDALESFAQVCCLAPGEPGALYNLSLQYADLCCPAQTELIARHLIGLYPDWPAAHYMLLRALTALEADPAEIALLYRYLIKSDPMNASLRFAQGLMQLKAGNYAAGWDAQEWRWDIEPAKSAQRVFGQPRWSGGPLAGRCLLVTGEQGFGDILQFARYLPMLVERGARVVLLLDDNRAALARLLGRIEGVEVVVGAQALPPFDLHCPLASLPYMFDTTVDSIPAPPYLSVDAADVAAWKARLAHLPRPWVGLCWAGSSQHIHNVRRSLPLCAGSRYYAERQVRERRILAVASRVAAVCGLDGLDAAAARDAVPSGWTLAPLLERTAGTFVSLQVGPHAADIDALPASLRARIVAPLPAQPDFYETACLIRALDEVITVDTSAAHLSGAIGQRGRIITPLAPEWRWIERNGRSAWYPEMRLMTQEAVSGR